MALLAGVVALLGSGESLWLDELHSSWTVSGDIDAIGYRARAGNQSPVYFWALWIVNTGLGETLGKELALRGLSILAWSCSVWLVARYVLQRSSTQPARGIAVVTIGAWLILDRIHLFYATEARVYALVQLLSLANWFVVFRLLSADASENRHTQRVGGRLLLGLWLGGAVLVIYLHLTAGLSVFTQWFVLIAASWWQDRSRPERDDQAVPGDRIFRSMRIRYFAAAGVIAVASLPALLLSKSVWENRYQWESFAGDASLSNALSLLPFLSMLVPIALGRTADWFLSRRGTSSPTTTARIAFPLWLAATVGPWAIAWLVTATGIAPVFHRRFVIVSGLPLVLFAFVHWQQIRQPLIRLVVGFVVAGSLVVSQGSLDVWRSGDVIGWQRAEGWREATRWLDSRVATEDQVWVYSGLIEGRSARPLLSELQAEYLSFPLRGCYRVRDVRGAIVEPSALVGDWRQWRQQWGKPSENEARPSLWIVHRSPVEQLRATLRKILLQPGVEFELVEAPRSFGRVSIAAIRRVD